MLKTLELIDRSLLLPDDGSVRLPDISDSGRFLVNPEELVQQLAYGTKNPGYGKLVEPEEVVEYLTAWRTNVLNTDRSVGQDLTPQLFGSHVTNTITRVALVPERLRDQTFSLKTVYKQEELHFPRQGTGRDPEILGVLYNSLRALLNS